MDERTLPYDILRFDYKERLGDRFLTTHLHRFEASTHPVALVVLLEIINPWHPASEQGQQILNSLVREFQQSEAQSSLTRFEAALKQTNRVVREALDQTKSPVSCVALLLEPDQIHSSGIGTAKLALLRHGKLATILGSKNGYNETFAAVTSGDLMEDDWLFVANENFYAILAGFDSGRWLDEDIIGIGDEIGRVNRLEDDQRLAGVLLRYNPVSPSVNQTILWGESETTQQASTLLKLPKFNSEPLFFLVRRLIFTLGQSGRVLIELLLPRRKNATMSNLDAKSTLPRIARRFLPLAVLAIVLTLLAWVGYRIFGT